MRLVLPVAALVLLVAPVYAQTTPPAAVPPQATAASAPAAAPKPHPSASAVHHRVSMEERFSQANTTHDGHLTMEQAKAGYSTVARHFAAIDVAKKGYVTEDDIHAWEKAERDRHHEAQQKTTTATKG